MLGIRADNSLTPNILNENTTEYVNGSDLKYLIPDGITGSPFSRMESAAYVCMVSSKPKSILPNPLIRKYSAANNKRISKIYVIAEDRA